MSETTMHECTNCGAQVLPECRNYRYAESGLPNVILQGIEVADCPVCGNSDVSIPRVARIHCAIAQALVNSPARLTGGQLRFLRKRLGLSGEELGRYLHTDKTKISKWETGEDRIGPVTDRLVRLLTTSLDSELRSQVAAVAENLQKILDQPGMDWELRVDVDSMQTAFLSVSKAA
jgi:putative zinc finger/helix-turn-helix YgiT family protein